MKMLEFVGMGNLVNAFLKSDMHNTYVIQRGDNLITTYGLLEKPQLDKYDSSWLNLKFMRGFFGRTYFTIPIDDRLKVDINGDEMTLQWDCLNPCGEAGETIKIIRSFDKSRSINTNPCEIDLFDKSMPLVEKLFDERLVDYDKSFISEHFDGAYTYLIMDLFKLGKLTEKELKQLSIGLSRELHYHMQTTLNTLAYCICPNGEICYGFSGKWFIGIGTLSEKAKIHTPLLKPLDFKCDDLRDII